MLPSNLLVARSRSGKIKPVYVPLEARYLELASRLIEEYEKHINKHKGELTSKCQQFEEDGFDYRLVRGLVALLDRSATFEPRAYVDPQAARRAVFKAANRYPLVATDDLRQKAIAGAAAQLGVSSVELETSLWSDFEEELILASFVAPEPQELLRRYNLSLTQTLLFKAASLEFAVGSDYQRIFSLLKRLGLMYAVVRTDNVYHILVDGPISLFKLTERYGTSLAKLLPSVAEADDWSLKAQIVWGDRLAPRLLELALSKTTVRDLFPARANKTEDRYDSSVEAAFSRSFRALKLGWTLRREPELLVAGCYVFIPDFSFEKGNLKAYLEIVGFWTNEYMSKKLAKLRELDVENLLIAVDRSLKCSQLDEIQKNALIFFDKKVPVKPVVDYLKKLDEAAISEQLDTIESSRLQLGGDIIDVARLADTQSVSADALERWLRTNPVERYRVIGRQLIHERKLVAVKLKIKELSSQALPIVLKAIDEEGITSPAILLETLDFVVEWRGLDPDSALVRAKSD
jgi:hypothetical protein